MGYVVNFVGYRPSPRYPPNDQAWTRVRIMEAAESDGPFVQIEEQILDPVEPDPTDPILRNLTTTEATLEAGWYQLIFVDEDGNLDPTDPRYHPSVPGYPSAAELVAASDVQVLIDLEPDRQEGLRLDAISAIEAYCKQSFTPEGTEEEPVTYYADGSGSDVLWLPKRLASLSSATVNGNALQVGDLQVESGQRLVLRANDGGTWADRALADVWTRQFKVGAQNVAITGVWGWSAEEFPDAVKTALRFDMEDNALAGAHALADTVHAARKLGVQQISQGNLNLALSTRAPRLSSRVRRLLPDYVRRSPAGGVV